MISSYTGPSRKLSVLLDFVYFKTVGMIKKHLVVYCPSCRGIVLETNRAIGNCQETSEKGSIGMKRLMQLLIGLSLVWAMTAHGADVLRFRGENSQ